MPHGMRCSLIVLALCGAFTAASAAGDAGPGKASTWTDPPARETGPVKPAAPAAEPTTHAATTTPAKPSKAQRTADREPPRVRGRAARHGRTRLAHQAPPHRYVPRETPHYAATMPPRPVPAWRVYPRYSEARFPLSYDDERLDRLGTAVGSGYLVMRRRTIEYPDGRSIRYYRPYDD